MVLQQTARREGRRNFLSRKTSTQREGTARSLSHAWRIAVWLECGEQTEYVVRLRLTDSWFGVPVGLGVWELFAIFKATEIVDVEVHS